MKVLWNTCEPLFRLRQIAKTTLLLVLLFSGPACELINPEEPVPAYLYLDQFDFSTLASQGSDSEKITEYWVFLDDEYLGAFPIPARIPLLQMGSGQLRVEAGIRDNGRSATPEIYPFYTPYTTTVDLEPNGRDTIRPNFSYRNNTRFSFIETFDQGGSIFQTLVTGTSVSQLKINTEDVFEGRGSGWIELEVTDPFVEIATSPRYRDLLANGNTVYLEVNYKSDNPVSFGVIGYLPNQEDPVSLQYQAGFNPSAEWNKIYFNLTPSVFASNGEEFQVILRAVLPIDQDGRFSQESAEILLDNIKLVHF